MAEHDEPAPAPEPNAARSDAGAGDSRSPQHDAQPRKERSSKSRDRDRDRGEDSDRDRERHRRRGADGERYLDRESGRDHGDRSRDRDRHRREYRERSERREHRDRDRSDDRGYRRSRDRDAERGDRYREEGHRRHRSRSRSESQRGDRYREEGHRRHRSRSRSESQRTAGAAGGGGGRSMGRSYSSRGEAGTSRVASPATATKFDWTNAEEPLYKCCIKELQTSGLTPMSGAFHKTVAQKLNQEGLTCTSKQVANKIRNSSKKYIRVKTMDPSVVKDDEFWENTKNKRSIAFRDAIPKHFNLMKKLFEPQVQKGVPEQAEPHAAAQEHLPNGKPADTIQHPQSPGAIVDESEAKLSGAFEELIAANLEMTTRCDSLEERFNKEKADKLLAVQSYEKERQERESAEASRDVLTVDLERVTHEAKRFSEQLKMVQDTNKSLQEYNGSLQQYNSNLQADATMNGEIISKLQREKSAMMEAMTNLKDLNNSIKNQLDSSMISQKEAVRVKEELRKEVECLRTDLQQVRDDRDQSVSQVNTLTTELATYSELARTSSKDCAALSSKVSAFEETCNSQQEQIETLQKNLADATDKLKHADVTAIEAMTGYEEQKMTIKDLEERLAYAEFQIIEADKLRKKLHNTILELKGNIRVFCRVRPLSDSDSNSQDEALISYPSSVENAGRGIDLMNQGQKCSFSYDKVFSHSASQDDVFVEISQLVQSALDGYKVCIFAYGQTGSGKTYTMMGKPGRDQKGIIPRSLEKIFKTSQSLESQGWKYCLQASMLEIYNETIRDLLAPGRSNSVEMSVGKQYTIKHDAQGNTTVSDLTTANVFSTADVTSLLEKASHSRAVGKTQMNEQSSRSHFVFTLKIFGSNESTGQQVHGVLNLIDLAGSERLAKSGSTGDTLKETQAINKSLSALSDVIFAIAKNDGHVPFRNSKLTYLLQPCLGGDSKTLMFVNIAPEASSINETVCSLRFASRVNTCEIGVARRKQRLDPRTPG